MNIVIMTGNLASDPEYRTTQEGIACCTFRLAVERTYRKGETDFFTVVAWRQLAEQVRAHCAKGKRIGVQGSLQCRSYTAQDGSRRSVCEIIADRVEFLSPAAEQTAQPAAKPAPSPKKEAPRSDTGFTDYPYTDELPF